MFIAGAEPAATEGGAVERLVIRHVDEEPWQEVRASAPVPRVPSRPSAPPHSLAVMTARRIAIVPHTHWDREWYKSYQVFRLALVELIDTLIPLLERDASYPYFICLLYTSDAADE